MSEDYTLSDDRKDEILGLVTSECARAIGFDNVNAGELIEQREKALLYVKGEMPDLVMTLAGRSKVVSMDVADAIETALPDLIDIFTGGDDVVSFIPASEDDVEAAKQEEEYLRQVVFQKNDGWKVVYEAFKDALTCKTGVFAWRWDGEFEPQPELHTGEPLTELIRLYGEGTLEDIVRGDDDADGLPTFSFAFMPKNAKGRVVIEAIAPEDLAVAADTKTLATATYCAVRQRPRAQDLLAMGYPSEVIDALPAWDNGGTQPEAQARDTVGEGQVVGGARHDLRQVEIYRHYIRVWDADAKAFCLYQAITGGHGHVSTLIDLQPVSRIQLAAITPYIVPHRFYGESIADKLIDIQKIKSSLMRMSLDSGYFALNQRSEVAEDGMTADTLNDLLNNDPGRPVRVRRSGTVTPLASGILSYDPLQHLEYFSTVAEQRTGIVRNAQGLNPDTLHDTKGGVEILQNNAQKRLRLIARTFAETGYKDFLVNLHATIRENGASMRDTVRLRDQWVAIDPSTWRQRDDMVIEIGVGSGGAERDMVVSQQIGLIQERLLAAQTEPDGPLISKANLYASATFALAKLGVKTPGKYVSDPASFQPPQQGGPPPPDPKLIKVQGELGLKSQALRAQVQNEALAHQRESDKNSQDVALRQYQIDAEIELRREQSAAELALRERQMEAQIASRERISQDASLADVELGGEPG